MPDSKKDGQAPLEQDGELTDSWAALLQKIKQEMGTMTPEELERLYALVALLDAEQDE
ncbi:hypothetical protein LJC36_03640 [Desulfovibrio sp. OttesenSCG-928-C14]|nr:hypothetical protein [Desulfovibrio sp. OttesenSCG-928-C14]